ncbi:unnamed protein product [Phytomonas sp. EM1]|nr:unnamed protein product [Phytomonas sp. EM1]|eukprot:CCW60660.1 unnamed protein product [Phytomonas sp. isolate EM1]
MKNFPLDTELWLTIVNDIEVSSLVYEGSYIVYEVLNKQKDRVVRSGIVKSVKDNVVTIIRPYPTQKTPTVYEEKERLSNAGSHYLELSTTSLSSIHQHLQKVETAQESVSKILDSHINEIAGYSSPPNLVCVVFQTVIDIMRIPMSDISWKSIQSFLRQGGFIQRMTLFDASSLSQQERADVIQRFDSSEILKSESISKVPHVVTPLLEWIWAQIELLKSLRCQEDSWDEVSMFSCRSHWSDFTTDTHGDSSGQPQRAVSHFLKPESYIEETLLRSSILNVYSCEPPDNDPVTVLSEKLWRPELMKCLQKRLVEIATTHALFHKNLMSCSTQETLQHGILSENPAKSKHDLSEFDDKLSMHKSENYMLAEEKSKGASFSKNKGLQNKIEQIRVLHDKNKSLIKSHFLFIFQDNECMARMNNIPDELQKAFACEVAQCCGVPLEHVVDVVFAVGALRVDLNILHSAVLSADALCARLHAHRLSILRLFDVNFGGPLKRIFEGKEYTCELQTSTAQPNTVTQIESLHDDSTECEGDTFLTQREGFKREMDQFLANRTLIEREQVGKVVDPFDAADCVVNELPTTSDYHLDQKEALLETAGLENAVGAKEESALAAFAEYQLQSTALTSENIILRERISEQREVIVQLRDRIDQLNNELHELRSKLGSFHKSISIETITSPRKQETFGFVIADDTAKTQSLQADLLHSSLVNSVQLGIQQNDANMAKNFSSANESLVDLSADPEVVSQIFFQQQMELRNLSKISKSVKGPNDGVPKSIKKRCNINSSQSERIAHEDEEAPRQTFALASMNNLETVYSLSRKPEALHKPCYEEAEISVIHDTRRVRSLAAPHGLLKGGTPLGTNDETSTFCLDHSVSSSDAALQFGGRSCEASSSKTECRMCAQLKQSVLQYKHYCHRIEWCYTESKKLNDTLLEQVGLLRRF